MSNNQVLDVTERNEETARRDGRTVPPRLNIDQILPRTEVQDEQLLPGLPNEITLDLITPKLPWHAISLLSFVSRAWQYVIRSHQVYNSRVRSRSTAKFVLINRYLSPPSPDPSLLFWFSEHSIALYSVREKWYLDLPPIPHLRRGFPYSCQCVALHGKIYILGGEDEFHPNLDMGFDFGSTEVYMCDLYGQRQWKRCASMECPRLRFGCGVLNGKIYVFGGFTEDDAFRDSEVYDPEADAWSSINPLPSTQDSHQVATVGEELFVHSGRLLEENRVGGEEPLFWEVYNPVVDEWGRIDYDRSGSRKGLFVARGKFHSVTQFAIHVHDIENNSWTLLHTCSFDFLGPRDSVSIQPLGTVAVDDEVLVRVKWFNRDNPWPGSCLLQSRGFGSESKEIVWVEAEGSPSFRGLSSLLTDFMPLMEL